MRIINYSVPDAKTMDGFLTADHKSTVKLTTTLKTKFLKKTLLTHYLKSILRIVIRLKTEIVCMYGYLTLQLSKAFTSYHE